MNKINISEINKTSLSNNYIWSNWNIQQDSSCIFYSIFYKNDLIMEIRCSYSSKYSTNIEFGIVKLKRVYSSLRLICSYMFEKDENLKLITTYLVKGDFIFFNILKFVGFNLAVTLRDYLRIDDFNYDIYILSIEKK